MLRAKGIDLGDLAVVDAWVAGVGGEAFDDLTPLLRRTFSAFSGPERRLLAERVRRVGELEAAGDGPGSAPGDGGVDVERARRVVPRLRQILGLDP